HLADRATQEWLGWARRRPGRLLLLATARPGTWRDAADRVVLGPLDPQATGELVARAGVEAPDQRASIVARSAGNPLFALAIATAPEGELPTSVRDATDGVAARLDA